MDISFKDVSYTYQPNSPFEYTALKTLNFEIKSGQFIAIVGHTGSGKSTLIQHLNGLLLPTSGEVMIGDYVLSPAKKTPNIKGLREKVGIVFQYPEHQLFEETVEKDIGFGPRNFGVSTEAINERIPEVLSAVNLDSALLSRSPFELSGGQMRRVAIAGVLAMKPEVIVLDEPTAGLDPRGQQEIMDMFSALHKKEQLTTILVTHSMEDALKYADYVIILEDGEKILEGPPYEIFRKKTELKRVQLDVPEVLQFLFSLEAQLGISIPYENQDIDTLVTALKMKLRGDDDV